MDTSQKKDTGGIIAIIIIVLLVAIGGIYFWVTKNPSAPKSQDTSNVLPPRNDAEALNAEFASGTDVNINSDLNSLNDLGK